MKLTYEQWRDTNRHAHRIEFMRDYDGNQVVPGFYEDWLRRKYAAEHPTASEEGSPDA